MILHTPSFKIEKWMFDLEDWLGNPDTVLFEMIVTELTIWFDSTDDFSMKGVRVSFTTGFAGSNGDCEGESETFVMGPGVLFGGLSGIKKDSEPAKLYCPRVLLCQL
jgi:hypothetical protein